MTNQLTFASLKKRWRERDAADDARDRRLNLPHKVYTDLLECADDLESLEQRVRELRDGHRKSAEEYRALWQKTSDGAWYGVMRDHEAAAEELTALLGEESER